MVNMRYCAGEIVREKNFGGNSEERDGWDRFIESRVLGIL